MARTYFSAGDRLEVLEGLDNILSDSDSSDSRQRAIRLGF